MHIMREVHGLVPLYSGICKVNDSSILLKTRTAILHQGWPVYGVELWKKISNTVNRGDLALTWYKVF